VAVVASSVVTEGGRRASNQVALTDLEENAAEASPAAVREALLDRQGICAGDGQPAELVGVLTPRPRMRLERS
jgi:hypothetical protein